MTQGLKVPRQETTSHDLKQFFIAWNAIEYFIDLIIFNRTKRPTPPDLQPNILF